MAKTKSKSKPTLKNAGEASVKEMKKALKRGGGGQFLKRIPGDGYSVRFLTEPPKWFKFFEHYDGDRDDNRYFPCIENDCPGCADDLKASKRWLANALDIEDGKVVPLVLPSTLVSNLMKKYDKFGTMTDRDYELVKDGQGLDTEYDAIYDGPKKMKIDRYDLLDLESLLLAQVAAPDDDDTASDDDDDDRPKRTKDKGAKSKPKSKGKEKPPAKAKDKPKGKSAPPTKGKAKSKDKKTLEKAKKKSLSKK